MHMSSTNSTVDDKVGLSEEAACGGRMKKIINTGALHVVNWGLPRE